MTADEKAKALMGVLINYPSSFVNYFGYCIAEVSVDEAREAAGLPPRAGLVRQGDGKSSLLGSMGPEGALEAYIGARLLE